MPWKDNVSQAICSACDRIETYGSHKEALESGWVETHRRFSDGRDESFLFCPEHSKAFNAFADKQDEEFEVFMKGLRNDG